MRGGENKMGRAAKTHEEDLNDPKVRAAFRSVASACGLGRAESRRLRAFPGAAGEIRSLAGTAPEYQRHVVDRLLAGDRSPFRTIAATLLVYDTVGFDEVTSRLHRALGMVREEAGHLERRV